ncbi:MAG: hypothetical protein ACRDH7_09330 [Actinomycetota bacterium]
MPVAIIAVLITAVAGLIGLLVREALRRRADTEAHARKWEETAARGLAGARSVLEDTNPLRLVVGFSATETPAWVQRKIEEAEGTRGELGAVVAGHPYESTRNAASDLAKALSQSLAATAIYVRSIADGHDSQTREQRAEERHLAAVQAADRMATQLNH